MEYEICFLVGESKEAKLNKIKSEIEKIVKKQQGVFSDDEWEKKRRLAYEIKKESRGTYITKRFSLPDKDERDEKFSGIDFIGEMTKDLNFNQDILRFVIVKTEELLSLAELKEREKKNEERQAESGSDAKSTPIKDAVSGGDAKSVVKSKKKSTLSKDADQKGEADVKKSDNGKEDNQKDNKKKGEKDVLEGEDDGKDKKEEVVKERKTKSKPEKKELSDDDIDEKLDEILNI